MQPDRRIAALDRPRVPRPALVFTAVGAVLIGVYYTLPLTGQDALFSVFGVASVTAVVFGAFRYVREHRLAWLLFAAGLFGFVVGDAIFSY